MASPREEFLATVDDHYVPIVQALDVAVRRACPDFDIAIKYRMLTYTLGKDYRNWICAISVTKRAVNLRFLYGVLLTDPQHVLRAGTSILKTLDIPTFDAFDAQLVTDYVTEAVGKYAAFKAQEREKLQKK